MFQAIWSRLVPICSDALLGLIVGSRVRLEAENWSRSGTDISLTSGDFFFLENIHEKNRNSTKIKYKQVSHIQPVQEDGSNNRRQARTWCFSSNFLTQTDAPFLPAESTSLCGQKSKSLWPFEECDGGGLPEPSLTSLPKCVSCHASSNQLRLRTPASTSLPCINTAAAEVETSWQHYFSTAQWLWEELLLGACSHNCTCFLTLFNKRARGSVPQHRLFALHSRLSWAWPLSAKGPHTADWVFLEHRLFEHPQKLFLCADFFCN